MPANLPVGWWVSEPPLDPALPPRHAKPMHTTRVFLIRHALVTPAARSILYGSMDVALCQMTLRQEAALYRWLAARLPPGSHWVTSQLARTKATAAAIFAGGQLDRQQETFPHPEFFAVQQHIRRWRGDERLDDNALEVVFKVVVAEVGRFGARWRVDDRARCQSSIFSKWNLQKENTLICV